MFMPSIFGDNLFDGFFDDFTRPVRRVEHQLQVPSVMKTDVKETETGYQLDIELPGYKKEDVKAELKDEYLTITATKNEEKEEKTEEGKFLRRERFYGSCTRSYYVGEAVTKEDIKAKFENGVLTLLVPKKELLPKEPEQQLIEIG